ncbi:hypothetical protein E2C01_066299 [Portunus trituberculatus]|uniref:Uncharacterized protein n=1 Tax=Portunus trituberculatus TaxID=210409 RepID=A0A5B7HRY9_PORTR|nr:hypothetical protein [Portunus trituberculatus]
MTLSIKQQQSSIPHHSTLRRSKHTREGFWEHSSSVHLASCASKAAHTAPVEGPSPQARRIKFQANRFAGH